MLRTPLILILLFSCSRTIDIALPHTQKLVIHGYIAVGDRFMVSIDRTVNTQMPDTQRYIKNAWVALYANDVFIDSLLFYPQEKKYISRQASAEPGKTYTIKAGAPGYPTAEATAAATAPVPTLSVSHIKNARLDDVGQFLDDVQFSFQDPAGVSNYYLTSLHASTHAGINLLCVYAADPAIDRKQADLLPTGEGKCIEPKLILFNDRSFDGTTKTITLSAWPRALETIRDDSGVVHKPYLKRYAISEVCYKYLKNISSQDYELGFPSLKVPATGIGNVNNGYGLFTIFSVITDSLP
ncbi:DUF4249 family protein [Longitalea arenae]|uniref:DUF4249 family protein n=1 Tax=Longitalea arenae TaxID=2812558 RepID=UPI001966DA57|nr:DUF4249 family protein [Longitalea arenae]